MALVPVDVDTLEIENTIPKQFVAAVAAVVEKTLQNHLDHYHQKQRAAHSQAQALSIP